MKKTLSLLLVTFAFAAQAQITSTFDTDDDGWTFLNASNVNLPGTFQGSNGNPGGYVSATYASNQNASYQQWFAPSKFLGNHLVLSLGMNLQFDLQQSQAGTATSGVGDVRIENGSTSIIFTLPTKPAVAPAWSSYVIAFDETTDWRVGSPGGAVATRTQIISILKNVTSIEIRGTYASNPSYTSGLDNVVLEQRVLPTPPGVSSISITSGKPGDVITINGSGFNPDKFLNTVSFGMYASIKATIQSATATQLTVVVPQGATYGPITITNNLTGLTTKTLTPFNPVFDGGGRIITASFAPKIDISTIPMEGVFVADVDGDGWEDLAVTNNNAEDAIDIYRNLGLGGSISAASFATKVTIPTPPLGGSGTNGAGLWFADLDGDGMLDAITSNATSPTSSAFVTLRNISTPGTISFEAPEYWAGGSDETPINHVADLDGDGRPEIVGGEGASSSSTFSYFWFNQNISSKGNIDFGTPIYPFNGTVVNGFAGSTTGDLNGDGKIELIISGTQGQSITVLQNTSVAGIPSFTNAFTLSTNQYNGSIKIIDINLDGKNDMIYRVSGETGIHIRLNSNSGGALSATDFVSDIIISGDLSTYGGMTIADINGDGKIDIVASDNGDVGVYENVYSGGVFDASAFVPAYQHQGSGLYTYPTAPVIADLNRDGKPEIIVGVTNSTPNKFSIYENKNVDAPVISLNTVSPLAAPVGATVTITGHNFSTTPADNHVYFGAVKATVLTASPIQITVSVPAGATYAPVSVRKGELTSRYRLPFRTTFGPGVTFDNTHFAPPINFTLTSANFGIDVGDLNRDGKPDIIAQGNGSYAFRNTHALGAISTSSLLPDDTLSNSILNPRLEDFDGDGLLDVAAGQGSVQKNNSTSSEINFLALTSLGGGGSTLDFNDFNADGKMDIVITVDGNGTNDLKILENRTAYLTGNFVTGTYSSFSTNFLFAKPAPFGGVVVEDFDGDGFPDMVTTNPGTDNVSIYRNLGLLKISAAQFAARVDVAVGDNPGRIYKGDFDADGKVDLMLYHGTGTTTTLLIVLQNTSTTGNISFSRVDLTNPTATTVAHIADLDGDGKPEIITTSEAGDIFSIFKNVHTSGVITAASFAAPFNTTVNNPRALATGDLNLDGKPEIIITAAPSSLWVYENLISSGPTISITLQPTSTAVCNGSNASLALTATGADNLTYQWQKFDGTVFNNVNNGGGYSGTTTATLGINTTGNFGAGDYRCLIKGDLAPDKFSNIVTLTVNAVPTAPTANGNSNCIPAAIALIASGGTNGQYRWYDASGVIIAAQVNSTYVTPVISATTNYSVAINNGSCESTKTVVTATIQPLAKPTLVSSRTITGGNVNLCDGENFTLTAPAGFTNYNWSNGESTQQITIDEDGSYSVILTDAASCVSPSSDPVTVVVNPFPLAEITANGTQLTASSGDSYQWYQNDEAVVGATNQAFDFNFLEYGVYVVDVTDNGCTSTSDEFEYLITGLENLNDGLTVFPNPVEENLFVEFKPPYTVHIFSTAGSIVTTVKSNVNNTLIDFSTVAQGVYILQLKSEKGVSHYRIIKK